MAIPEEEIIMKLSDTGELEYDPASVNLDLFPRLV